MRLFIALLLFTLIFTASGVSQTGEMPVGYIPQVTVTKSNRAYFSDEQTTLSLRGRDNVIITHQPIGYLLAHESPALIKSYGGAGSLVSISLHGTGASHTQVSWNGFPVNSPTTGQADLSMIPAGFMQTVDVINGASGALFGSGTFGGTVNLGNDPDWTNRIRVDYSMNAGSYGTMSHMASVRTGGRIFQFHLSAMTGRAENNFDYRDIYRYMTPVMSADHNAYQSRGFIQNLYLNMGGGNYLETGVWYQQKSKEMPRQMGSYKENHAEQEDSLFRAYLNYKRAREKSLLVLKSGWFSDYLRYTDKVNPDDSLYAVNSGIATGRFMNEANYRYYLNHSITLGGGVSYSHISGNSNNYGGRVSENEFSVFGNLRISHGKWIANTGIRKEFYDDVNPGIQFSGGVRFKATRSLILRSSVSSKFRKPTFNEKYWIPGGNPALNPERGWGGEVSGEWLISGDLEESRVDFLFTAYYQKVENWIQWVIRDSLTPTEYKQVNAGGIETRLNYEFRVGELQLNGFLSYDLNHSVISDTYDNNEMYLGNQLMYIPLHSAKMSLKASFGGFMAGTYGTYTGARETVETADVTLRMPAYALFDVFAGYNREFRSLTAGIYFRIDNLLNTSYQVIRSYPMPGRSYYFTLTFGFEKNSPDY